MSFEVLIGLANPAVFCTTSAQKDPFHVPRGALSMACCMPSSPPNSFSNTSQGGTAALVVVAVGGAY